MVKPVPPWLFTDAPPEKGTSLSKEEWREVMRELRPDVTDQEFDAAWELFQDWKARHRLQ